MDSHIAKQSNAVREEQDTKNKANEERVIAKLQKQ
jgi:hypothetical protein